MVWGYLLGIRDTVAQKNDHRVNIMVTPTILLPSASTSSSTPATKKANPAKKKAPILPKTNTKLKKAKEDARLEIAQNVKSRIRELKKFN